jgi:hypothetical protein
MGASGNFHGSEFQTKNGAGQSNGSTVISARSGLNVSKKNRAILQDNQPKSKSKRMLPTPRLRLSFATSGRQQKTTF